MKRLIFLGLSLSLIAVTGIHAQFVPINQLGTLPPVEGLPLPISPGKTLPSDFLIANYAWYENTGVAAPPSGKMGCADGAIVVMTGQDRPGVFLQRPLYKADTIVTSMAATTQVAIPADAVKKQSALTDGQILRMKDGSFLACKLGWTAKEMTPHPSWWDATKWVGGTLPAGARCSAIFWRSTDCGTTWKEFSEIDAADYFSGDLAWPQFPWWAETAADSVDVNGKYKYWIGGWDRQEIYQDPWNGYLYVGMWGRGGPYPAPTDPNAKGGVKTVIFVSKDNGGSWIPLRTWDNVVDVPIMMTSVPNGRFFALMVQGGVPVLYYTSSYNSNILVGGSPVTAKDSKGTAILWANDTLCHLSDHPWVPQIGISRVSFDKGSSVVRLSYSALQQDGTEVIHLLDARVISDAEVQVKPITTLKPGVAGKTLWNGAFIDPDYADMPANMPSNTAVYYYQECSRDSLVKNNAGKMVRKANPNVNITTKYVLLSNRYGCSIPVFASKKNDVARVRTVAASIGDYARGGFYLKDNELHYVLQWREADGIHCNIVTTPYQTPDPIKPIRNPNLIIKEPTLVQQKQFHPPIGVIPYFGFEAGVFGNRPSYPRANDYLGTEGIPSSRLGIVAGIDFHNRWMLQTGFRTSTVGLQWVAEAANQRDAAARKSLGLKVNEIPLTLLVNLMRPDSRLSIWPYAGLGLGIIGLPSDPTYSGTIAGNILGTGRPDTLTYQFNAERVQKMQVLVNAGFQINLRLGSHLMVGAEIGYTSALSPVEVVVGNYTLNGVSGPVLQSVSYANRAGASVSLRYCLGSLKGRTGKDEGLPVEEMDR